MFGFIYTLMYIACAAAYDPWTAMLGWNMSRAAYCRPYIEPWSCSPCQDVSRALEARSASVTQRGDTMAYTALLGSNTSYDLAVVFRGSSTIRNWMTDLDIVTSEYPYCPGCMVHTGFLRAYNSIQQPLESSVARMLSGARRVMVFGHSLGGALATLFAAAMLRAGTRNLEVYTYGQPRVGNRPFAIWYDGWGRRHFRVTHHRDPVPHLPPAYLGFDHVALELFYDSTNHSEYHVCHGPGEDPACSNRYGFGAIDVRDHLWYLGVLEDARHCVHQGSQMQEQHGVDRVHLSGNAP